MNLLVPTPSSPFLLPAHPRGQKDLERESAAGPSVPANPGTPPPRQARWERRRGRWPGQPRQPLLSHAQQPATARTLRTLQPRPEVEGKHGSVPGRWLPRAAAHPLAGPHPHLTLWGIHPAPGRLAVQACREPPRAAGDMLGTLCPQASQPGKDPLG